MKNIIVFFLLISIKASAQNAVNGDEAPYNKFSIDVLTPLHFNYNSTLELFQPKIIYNAIRLDMKIKQESVGVFGQVRFFTTRPSAFSNKMTMKMKYTDSPNASSPVNDVILTTNPSLLVSQPGNFKSVNQFKYLFDLKLNPPESYEGLQSQGFSIIYTISVL